MENLNQIYEIVAKILRKNEIFENTVEQVFNTIREIPFADLIKMDKFEIEQIGNKYVEKRSRAIVDRMFGINK